jgi:hypothetical protein
MKNTITLPKKFIYVKAQAKAYATALFLLLFSFASFAQTFTVSGKVTSKEDGTPLPAVTIRVKGTQQGTATDIDGIFGKRQLYSSCFFCRI